MHHHGYTELLPHVGIKRVRYFWGKNRGKWKGRQPPGIESRTPASALQLSYDDQSTNQPSQCSTYTAQVGLKCLSLTPGNHSVCAVRSQKLFLPQKHHNSLYSNMRQEFCAFGLRKPFSMYYLLKERIFLADLWWSGWPMCDVVITLERSEDYLAHHVMVPSNIHHIPKCCKKVLCLSKVNNSSSLLIFVPMNRPTVANVSNSKIALILPIRAVVDLYCCSIKCLIFVTVLCLQRLQARNAN